MQDIIQLLPDSLANQIAAGEVVQRPASIVKELLENAIDAQATYIRLVVREAGKELVQVIDDGMGMSETDARMSLERHATSKIKTTDDLFNIRTMGFRGEALASIAAVAQMEIKTKRAMDELGTHLYVEASRLHRQESISATNGTTISVKNLFFNVPARRNFLKSNQVEMRHIIDEFQRVALAHPNIAFDFFNQDTEVYSLPAGKLSQRIVHIFGKNYQKQLAPCQEETPFVSLYGYIGKPEQAKKTRGEQFFFVNNRYIRHSYLHHAVASAYEGLLPKEAHPFYVICLEIDPIHIDINIHPTKTEVKFDDERTVYGILHASVKKALQTHHVSNTLDFTEDTNFSPAQFIQQAYTETYQTANKTDYKADKIFTPPSPTTRDKNNLQNWDKMYAQWQQEVPETNKPLEGQKFSSGANVAQLFETDVSSENRSAILLQQRYLVTPAKSGLMIIDYQAAMQRIWFDRLQDARKKNQPRSQQILFPTVVEINQADWVLLAEMEEELRALGLNFEALG
ncbi:MAG: DNA mismatch repair endonuclease MutL, partial [Bacteroidetes bacterium]